MKTRFFLFAVTAMSLAATGTVEAAHTLQPNALPACLGTAGADHDACRLPLKNGDFSAASLAGWSREGLPSTGFDMGNPYAALHTGGAIRQAVYAHTTHGSDAAAYVLHFRIRADRDDTIVGASLAMSDDLGGHAVPMGRLRTVAQAGEWSTVELIVQGKAFVAPAHVLVSIANEGGNVVQVDDVYLVESLDAETVSR